MKKTNENYLAYINENYRELAALNSNEAYRTMLVQRSTDGRIFVRKEVMPAQGDVYRQIQSIRHPNLVEVHQVVYDQNKCIVLEDYVSGRSLQEELGERGALPVGEAMNYFFQLLNGLEVIHRYRIIHRDIKPENILISVDGVVKLLDFGIARFQKPSQPKDTVALGTVGYASPEQFGFQQTDVRTDIYAAGILLNKMLTGRMPDEEQVSNVKLRRIIAKCIEIDPRNRFATVQELQKNLKRALDVETYGSAVRKIGGLEKEEKAKEDLTWIPGFRTGVTWKKVLACIGYGVIAFANVMYLVEGMAGGIRGVLLEAVAMFLYSWLPVMIGSNLCRWDRKLPGFRRLPKELRITFRFVLCLLICNSGIALENYVRYNLIGLSK